MHRHTFNWINQPDAATSQVYYLSFKYSSTCFGASSRPSSGATTTEVQASGLTLERGDSSAVGPDCYYQAPTVNQRLLLQLLYLLMMGMRMPETCWAIFKRQVINLRSCCILLVDSVGNMMMHGLANPKFNQFRVSSRTFLTIFEVFSKLTKLP